MTLYETTIVLDPQLKGGEIEEMIKKTTNFITNHGGEIVNENDWGKRRLAYEINKKQYGYFYNVRFSGPGQLIGLLEREYRLSETVLRYLTIKVDKRALKLEDKRRRAEEAQREAAESARSASDNETTDKEKSQALRRSDRDRRSTSERPGKSDKDDARE